MLIMGATRAHRNYVKSADTGGVAGAVLERKKRTLDEIRRLAPEREGHDMAWQAKSCDYQHIRASVSSMSEHQSEPLLT